MRRVNHSSMAVGRAAAITAALVGILATGAACGGPTNPNATTVVITDTLVAWAINGTGAAQPSAYYLADNAVVQVTSALRFDVAFDVDSATGKAIVIPARLITDGSVLGFHVGLQHLTQPFDSVLYGLKTGYVFDSIYALSPGDGVMLVSNPPGCSIDPNPSLYGKFIIDSVNIVARTVHFRATEDPNCGYRSFAPGIPKF